MRQIIAFRATGSCDHRAMLHVSEGGAAVALRWSSGDRKAEIEFTSPRFRYRDASDPYLASDDMVEYTVRLSGNGLAAEVLVLSLDTAGSGLPASLSNWARTFETGTAHAHGRTRTTISE